MSGVLLRFGLNAFVAAVKPDAAGWLHVSRALICSAAANAPPVIVLLLGMLLAQLQACSSRAEAPQPDLAGVDLAQLVVAGAGRVAVPLFW